MRVFSILLILFILLPVIYFSSCVKSTEYNDNEKPEIWDIEVNLNDTINYSVDTGGKIDTTYHLYNKDPNKPARLAISKYVYISFKIKDNENLSSYAVKLEAIEGQVKSDTTAWAYFVASGRDVFNKKDSLVHIEKQYLQIVPYTMQERVDNETKTFNVQTGNYRVTVIATDWAGKEQRAWSDVELYTRKQILEMDSVNFIDWEKQDDEEEGQEESGGE